jgi:hypothetical protein
VSVTIAWTETEAKANGVDQVYSAGLYKYMALDELDDLDADQLDGLGVVVACTEVQISFCAEHIIENACEDLHEGAYDNLPSAAFAELEEFLDSWVEKYGKYTTSWAADGRVITIDVEKRKQTLASEGCAEGSEEGLA